MASLGDPLDGGDDRPDPPARPDRSTTPTGRRGRSTCGRCSPCRRSPRGGRRASSPASRSSAASRRTASTCACWSSATRQHKASDPEFDEPAASIDSTVTNGDLAVGGTLSNRIVSDHGPDGLPEGSIEINLNGSAGQTVGAWLAPGVEMSVEGDVNDYAGQGPLGRRPRRATRPARATSRPPSNVIAGNVALYGATARPRLLRRPRRRALRASATRARWPSSRASASTPAST